MSDRSTPTRSFSQTTAGPLFSTNVWINSGWAALPADLVVSALNVIISSAVVPLLGQQALIPEEALFELPPRRCSFSMSVTRPPLSKIFKVAARPARPVPMTIASGSILAFPTESDKVANFSKSKENWFAKSKNSSFIVIAAFTSSNSLSALIKPAFASADANPIAASTGSGRSGALVVSISVVQYKCVNSLTSIKASDIFATVFMRATISFLFNEPAISSSLDVNNIFRAVP
mmetsp:Transcript_8840/g.13193  ORF Transcript_8840/g.13193 Transcript_8840/m.13193 type:complete len:233 (+) Transcript_8840:1476-2174(+)